MKSGTNRGGEIFCVIIFFHRQVAMVSGEKTKATFFDSGVLAFGRGLNSFIQEEPRMDANEHESGESVMPM